MRTPKWAQELLIDACIYLGIDDLPALDWRHGRRRCSSGRCYGKSRILVTAGTDRTDAKMVLLHELAHAATPPEIREVKLSGKWMRPDGTPWENPTATQQVSHGDAFWDTAWRLYRWAKLPIRYCLQRETDYRKGAAVAYRRSK